MASGYFPIDRNYGWGGKRLLEMVADIKKLSSEMYDASCQDNNGEDGVADGAYFAYLEIAAELLERCVQKV